MKINNITLTIAIMSAIFSYYNGNTDGLILVIVALLGIIYLEVSNNGRNE